MFARWRNLAAAAGIALCFPFTLAQAAAHRDDSQSNPPSICAGLHDSRPTVGCFGCEYEYWYERYYRNSWDEYGSLGEELEDNQSNEKSTVIDSEGRCSDPTCPCHDPIDLDDESDPSESPNTDAVYPPSPLNVAIHYLDVCESFRGDALDDDDDAIPPTSAVLVPRLIGMDEQPRDSQPQIDRIYELNDGIDDSFESALSAQLTGTIEPESDKFDGETMDGLMLDDRQYHMFYPGCDWTPYYPPALRPETKTFSKPTEKEFPECSPSARTPGSFPFHGAAWMWQGASSVVTWTGKLGEQFNTLMKQTGASISAQGMASGPFAD